MVAGADGRSDAQGYRGDLSVCGEVASNARHIQKARGCFKIRQGRIQPNDIPKLEPVRHSGTIVLHLQSISEDFAIGGKPDECKGHHSAEPDFLWPAKRSFPPCQSGPMVDTILVGGVEKNVCVRDDHASAVAGSCAEIGFGL